VLLNFVKSDTKVKFMLSFGANSSHCQSCIF